MSSSWYFLYLVERNSLVANKYMPKWYIDPKPRVCSEAIQTALGNLGIPYDMEIDEKQVIDVTPVFDPVPSAAGDRILDFFTMCLKFRANASEDTLAEGLDLVQHFCDERKDGKVMANVKSNVFVIKRPLNGDNVS